MSQNTFILGKTTSLEETLHTLKNSIHEAGFEVKEAPINHPVKSIYSLHIKDADCKAFFTNGKGTSEKSCHASAYAEFMERLATNYFFSDYYLGESEDWLYFPSEKSVNVEDWRNLLTPELWEFYAQSENWQAAYTGGEFLSLNENAEVIRALPMQNLTTNETVYFPNNIFSNLYASNGLAAGNSATEARIQGLSEIFERWVKAEILKNNWCLPVIPESAYQDFEDVMLAKQQLEERGIQLSIRDASLGGKYPVICVVLFEQKEGRCFASFGAHPTFEVALERTVTESLQGRQLQNLDGFQVPIFNKEMVSADENIENHFIDSSGFIHAKFISNQYDFEYQAWPEFAEMEHQWSWMQKQIEALGSNIYVADYQQHGFYTCRIIVPGISEIYPLEELVESNQNLGRILREALMNIDFASEEFDDQLENLLQVIEEQGFSDHQGVANIIGLLTDNESFWANINIAELKFWTLLALQDWEEAHEVFNNFIEFIPDSSSLFKHYQIFKFVFEMLESNEWDTEVFEQYEGWEILFDRELAEEVLAHLNLDAYFCDAPLGEEIFTTSQQHQKLLSAYQNLRRFKQQ